MILYVSYEELRALKAGADALLVEGGGEEATVLAPAEDRARVEAFAPLLVGDVSLSTLEQLRGVQIAVTAIVECLRAEMEATVLNTHAAHEYAVSAYFDFAHALCVADRLQEMASEMAAMIELVTGEPASPEAARTFRFPD